MRVCERVSLSLFSEDFFERSKIGACRVKTKDENVKKEEKRECVLGA